MAEQSQRAPNLQDVYVFSGGLSGRLGDAEHSAVCFCGTNSSAKCLKFWKTRRATCGFAGALYIEKSKLSNNSQTA